MHLKAPRFSRFSRGDTQYPHAWGGKPLRNVPPQGCCYRNQNGAPPTLRFPPVTLFQFENPDQKRFLSNVASKFTCLALFFTEPFLMSVAAGPFTTSDSLLYEPLADLMTKVQNDKPDLLILVSLMIIQMDNLLNL